MNRFDCCYECYVDFVAHEEQRGQTAGDQTQNV